MARWEEVHDRDDDRTHDRSDDGRADGVDEPPEEPAESTRGVVRGLLQVVHGVVQDVQPSSSAPTSRMCPPTHSIAAVPTTVSTVSTIGIARDQAAAEALRTGPESCARRSPASSIFTIRADRAVHQRRS